MKYVLVLIFVMGGQTSIKTVKDDFITKESCEKAMQDASILVPVDKLMGGTGRAYYECRTQEEEK